MHRASFTEPPGFARLSKAEQIDYVQRLWDKISHKPGNIPIPESHLRLAEQRLQEYRANPTDTQDSFEVINRLRKKSR